MSNLTLLKTDYVLGELLKSDKWEEYSTLFYYSINTLLTFIIHLFHGSYYQSVFVLLY